MSHGAIRALVEAQWQADWNRGWRFSRVKAGLWMFVLQLGISGLLFWRLGGQDPIDAVGVAVLAVALQQGLAGFGTGFLQGREALYSQRILPLIHVTTVSPTSLIIARVLAGIPSRAGWLLPLSAALGALLPAGAWWWAVPLLWTVGLACGLLGQLAGLLSLVGWMRVSPRAVTVAWIALLLVTMGVVYYVIYLLAAGIPVQAMAEAMMRLRNWALAAIAGMAVLPGLAMITWLLVRPGVVGAVYREGWLRLRELSDAGARALRSWLPRPGPGAFGTVLGWEVARLRRNPLTFFRLAAWGAMLAVLVWLSPTVAGERQAILALGAGLGITVFVYAELMAALVGSDGQNFALYVLAGVRPGGLLAAKVVAGSLHAVFATLSVWAASVVFGMDGESQMRLAALGGLVGLGLPCVIIGTAAAGFTPPEEEAGDVPLLMAQVFEQAPRDVAGWAAFGAGSAYAAAAVWAVSGAPGFVGVALALAPAGALAAGYLRLRQVLAV